MRPRSWLSATLLAATCIGGATCRITQLKSTQPVGAGSPLRLSGVVSRADAIPVPGPIVELDVPVNSRVRKGQVIGEGIQDRDGGPYLGWEASQHLGAARAAVAAARNRFRIIESAIAAARASAVNREYGLVTAEVAAIEAENAIANSDRLYRQGIESEVQHDEALALHQTAQRQDDAEQSRAGSLASHIDELEARRMNAQAALGEAEEQRRVAEAAEPNGGGTRGEIPVISPADGFLVMRSDYPGAFEIIPDSGRFVFETEVSPDELTFLRPGRPVAVYVEDLPGTPFPARLDAIVEAHPGVLGRNSIPVVLSVTNIEGIRAGQTRVTVSIERPTQSSPR